MKGSRIIIIPRTIAINKSEWQLDGLLPDGLRLLVAAVVNELQCTDAKLILYGYPPEDPAANVHLV